MKIIRGGEKDFEKFYKLFEESLKEKYFKYSPENASYLINEGLPKRDELKKAVLKKEKYLYLAYEKDKLIGYLLVSREFAGVAFGNWLAVHKDFRKKGIGSKLLTAWENDVLKTPAHALQLWTTKNDIGFYERNGFVVGGRFEKAWLGIDHYFLYKSIGKPNSKKYT